jgi:hypothetical protein
MSALWRGGYRYAPGALFCTAVLLASSLASAAPDTAAAQTSEPVSAEVQLQRAYFETHPYLNDEFSPGEGTESGIDDLDQIGRPETPILDTDGFDGPLSYVRGKFDALHERTGLRLGVAYTALGMAANGANDPNGAAHDLDLMSAWTLVGRNTPNTGVLVTTAEYRDKIGNDPASSIGSELGTLINTVNAFNDRQWVVRDTYWLQRFYDDKLRILAGRADTSDFIGQQPMQNVNAFFANRSFAFNPTVPSPGHGPTIGVSVRPNDQFYVTGAVANGYNNTTRYEINTIDDGDFYSAAEAGWTPTLEGMGTGRYSIMLWHLDSRNQNGFASPSDEGVTLVAGQQLTDRFQVWARYAHADAKITNIREIVQAGVGYSGLLGSPSNMTGFAASYAEPRSDASREEKVIEAFHRLQVSRFTQFSVGVQVIFDPGNNPDEDQVEVIYARLRLAL